MLAVLALSPVLGSCYTYTGSSLGELTDGDEVRARLTAAQFDELEEHLPGRDRVLDGEVIEVGPQRLLLEVPVTSSVQGIRVQSLNQRIEISADGLADVELRTLDRGRTYGLSGAGVVLVGYVIWDQLLSDTRRGGEGEPPPPPEDRRTLFKLPLIVW